MPTPVARFKEINAIANYVESQIIDFLVTESDRLWLAQKQRQDDNKPFDHTLQARQEAIKETITGLQLVLKKIAENEIPITNKKQIITALKNPIEDNLENFDKRKGDWGKKIARAVLNMILILALPKKVSTGSFWFKLEGETYQAGKVAIRKLDKIPKIK